MKEETTNNGVKIVSHGVVEHDIYVTKFALTKGIKLYKKAHVNLRSWVATTQCGKTFVEDDYTMLDSDNALTISETMRFKKINQLKKQIKKLETLEIKILEDE